MFLFLFVKVIQTVGLLMSSTLFNSSTHIHSSVSSCDAIMIYYTSIKSMIHCDEKSNYNYGINESLDKRQKLREKLYLSVML